MNRNLQGQFVTSSTNLYNGFGIWNDSKGYPCIKVGGKNVRLHVYIWEQANGSKPPGYDVHHIDFTKDNFALENLELLTCSDHRRIHAGWIRTDGVWTHKPCTRCERILPIDDFYKHKNGMPYNVCKPCNDQVSTQWVEKNRERRKVIARNYWHKKRGEPMEVYQC